MCELSNFEKIPDVSFDTFWVFLNDFSSRDFEIVSVHLNTFSALLSRIDVSKCLELTVLNRFPTSFPRQGVGADANETSICQMF